jgi:uncharacterized membrane protein
MSFSRGASEEASEAEVPAAVSVVVSGAGDFLEAVAVLAAGERAGDGDMSSKEFIELIDEAAVLRAVAAAEKRTSGEVRVFISRRRLRGRDVSACASAEFHRLDMDTTDDRNAVLFYVVPRERTFAVIGDDAVHAKCGQSFWDETAKALEKDFKDARFTEGLVAAIEHAADLLAAHFPHRRGDRNELPDEIGRD